MGVCRKWILRNQLPWLVITLALGLGLLGFAGQLPRMDQNLNEMYARQAEELGLSAPQTVADSGAVPIFLAVAGAAFLLLACLPLSKVLRPQSSRMGKSLLRYAKYEGEGEFGDLLAEAETDLAHGAVFGDVTVGTSWIAGRSFPPGGQAVRLSRICAAFHTAESVTRRGGSGAWVRTTWYHLYLFDEKKRQTELLTQRESDLMGAYRTLLRRSPVLLQGGEQAYNDFLDLPDEEQERRLGAVARENYEKAYYGGKTNG